MNDNAHRRSPPIERREFLVAASGVATGMIAPSALAGERKTPAWTMRQSTSSIHYAYHLQAAGESVEKAIEISGRQLFFFYAWQRAGGARQLPGHGPADFTPWIAALAKVKYRGYVNSFMHGELKTDAMSAALAKSRAYLKECSVSPVPGCRNISPNTNPGRCPGLSCCGPFGANSAGDVQEVIRLESTTRPMVRFTGTIRHLTTKSQPSVTSAIQRSLP